MLLALSFLIKDINIFLTSFTSPHKSADGDF